MLSTADSVGDTSINRHELEATVCNMEPKIQGDNCAQVFPFLRLPREIRDAIYTLLLIHPAIERRDGEANFVLHSAIMFTCRQTCSEARSVLFSFTEFIVFDLRLAKPLLHSHENPVFLRLKEEEVIRPVLRITIKPSEDRKTCGSDFIPLITNVDNFMSIIENIWADYILTPHFSSTLTILLEFNNMFPSRFSMLINQILLPWIHVQGFQQVLVVGDINRQLSRYIEQNAALGPSIQTVYVPMDEILAMADRYYKQSQYPLAKNMHRAAWRYFDYRVAWIEYNFRRGGPKYEAFVMKNFPYFVKLVWEGVKIALRLGEEFTDVLDTLKFLMKVLEENPGISKENVRPRVVPNAKIFICQATVNLTLGKHHDANELIKEASFWLQEFRGGTEDGYWSYYDELKWAEYHYLEELKASSRKILKLDPTSVERPTNLASHDKYRTLWEWMELPEEKFAFGAIGSEIGDTTG
jgi:hypothetical protein